MTMLAVKPAEKLAAVQAKRAETIDRLSTLAVKDGFSAEDQVAFDSVKKEIADLDAQILRIKDMQAELAKTAQPSPGRTDHRTFAAPETDPYVKDKSLLIGGIAKSIALGGGNVFTARQAAIEVYGESHPIVKALGASVGAAGGFMVPPDVLGEVIPLLRARAVVRNAGPRIMPMPRGTMTLPGQASAASATYGSETRAITQSQQTLNQIVATYKKLTALVPITNDLMRCAKPAIDAFVRDDLVKVIALREDLAFIMGDGTQDTPRGYLSFANGWVKAGGGTVGVWLSTAASTLAVNGTDPANSTGGNFITSTASFTLATVAAELAGAVNRLDTANVPQDKRVWFMHPRSKNYLYNVQNSLGVYVYRDEMSRGTLLGYPFATTTQIPVNIWDAAASNKDLSFVFLAEMTEDMIFDSMQMELTVSREGSYVDSTGATISAFQSDQTLIRAISEHDHQLRHDAAVAVIQGVRWAPAIS